MQFTPSDCRASSHLRTSRRRAFTPGRDVDCYVLNDANKTAVISQRGIGRALGLDSSGKAMPRFLATSAMSGAAGDEIREKMAQPIKFQWVAPGGETPPSEVHGFDVTLLIDICRLIVDAESAGRLTPRQERIATQAHVILNASAKAGIKNLVYALAGYNPTAKEVIEAFKLYVQEEAKKYEKEFPPELYAEWYRLYQIEPIKGRGRPWQFKHLTLNHVYSPLAKSNGKILKLLQSVKADKGDRQAKLFQFLNEVGTRALRFHMGRLYEIAASSQSKQVYEEAINERFNSQKQLTLPGV